MRLLKKQIAVIGTVPALRERCCSKPASSAIGPIPVTMTGGGGLSAEECFQQVPSDQMG